MLARFARPVCEAARTAQPLPLVRHHSCAQSTARKFIASVVAATSFAPCPATTSSSTTTAALAFFRRRQYATYATSTHIPTTTTTTATTTTTTVTMAPTDHLPSDRRPVVISGPSGVGKGTLFNLLRERHPDTFALSVSHTTRQPRAGETHGVHYYYVTRDAFEQLIAEDGFIEHAQFGGNRYGTSKQTVRDQTAKGQVVVLDIEMEGVKQLKKSDIEARYVFVAPPSEEVLEKRLKGRGTESEADVEKRLNQAKKELEYSKTPGVHDLIIVNDDLETAYKELEDFVYRPTQA